MSTSTAKFAIIPPQGKIGMHQDGLGSDSKNLQDRIEETVRLHIPVYTNEKAIMFIGDMFFHMNAGEMWMLNNYAYHGVLNLDEEHGRNHLIIDVIPSEELLELLKKEPMPEGYFDTKLLKFLLKESAKKKAKVFVDQLPFMQKLKLRLA